MLFFTKFWVPAMGKNAGKVPKMYGNCVPVHLKLYRGTRGLGTVSVYRYTRESLVWIQIYFALSKWGPIRPHTVNNVDICIFFYFFDTLNIIFEVTLAIRIVKTKLIMIL